jgi:hypothetical protein
MHLNSSSRIDLLLPKQRIGVLSVGNRDQLPFPPARFARQMDRRMARHAAPALRPSAASSTSACHGRRDTMRRAAARSGSRHWACAPVGRSDHSPRSRSWRRRWGRLPKWQNHPSLYSETDNDQQKAEAGHALIASPPRARHVLQLSEEKGEPGASRGQDEAGFIQPSQIPGQHAQSDGLRRQRLLRSE